MSTQYKAYTGKTLMVDLTAEKITEYPVSDNDRDMFLGNKGLAAKILYDNLAPGTDPLSPDNMIVISTSVLTGTGAPCSSRFNMSTKSPLTGILTSSNSGGNFGLYLKRAGLDALVIKGRAKKPVYIHVDENEVKIESAEDLWGQDTEKAQEALVAKHGKKAGVAVIGPAGENMVRYSLVMSNERATGRGGVGAVFGSKNLKGLVATGNRKVEVADPEKFKAFIKGWIKYLKEHPVTGKSLPAYGTAGMVIKANAMNCLPTKNFKSGNFEFAENISGEELAEKYLVKNDGCTSCPIRCARVVKHEDKNVKGPEFETVGMFGSNIMNKDLSKINEWNVVMDRLGMDTISAGGSIAFAMELTEKGMLKSDLEFGKTENIEKTLYDIAYRRGLGNDLAEGVMRLSEKYGGSEFAMHAKGLEFAAYEPRGAVGQGLGYATANRGGCHLNAGYVIYFEVIGHVSINPLTPYGKAGYAIFQQNSMEAISASGSCIFTSYAVLPGLINTLNPQTEFFRFLSKTLEFSGPLMGWLFRLPKGAIPFHLPMIHHSKAIALASGQKMDAGRFLAAGARAYNLERMFNIREGMALDVLPKRSTDEEQIPGRADTKVPLEKMLPDYYNIRGWDTRGVPKVKTLKFYNLEDLAKDLPDSNQSGQQLFEAFTKTRLDYEAKQAAFIAKAVKGNEKYQQAG